MERNKMEGRKETKQGRPCFHWSSLEMTLKFAFTPSVIGFFEVLELRPDKNTLLIKVFC